MGKFVLIHGACHGAWCWYKVIPQLQAAGHQVIAPDLPGHGIDKTPLTQVSMRAYVDAVVRLVQEQDEPVVLVGHSMGGPVVSLVAEEIPTSIRTLVYLAAPMLANGESVLDVLSENVDTTMQQYSSVDEQGLLWLQLNHVDDLFYNDCSAADIRLAQSLLVPQVVEPLYTPLSLSERYEAVPRCSIETLRDHTISIEQQRRLRARRTCKQIFTLDTSHSPFLSAPDELTHCLLAAAS